MQEVQNQLGPMNLTLTKLDRTVRSLYSNGSGGPPGYLETARKEDDERYERLFNIINGLVDHKKTVNDFILLAKDREERWVKLRRVAVKVGWKIAATCALTIGSLSAWAYHAAAPVIKVLWNDYLRYHPQLGSELKNSSRVNYTDLSVSYAPSVETSGVDTIAGATSSQ